MTRSDGEKASLKHEQLWAPWRLAYITGEIDKTKPQNADLALLPGADPQCFICRAVVDANDRQNLLVHRGTTIVTVLNRYPYNNGHLLVAPRLHKGRLDELTVDEQAETMAAITRLVSLLGKLLNAEGFNVGLNLGAWRRRAAGPFALAYRASLERRYEFHAGALGRGRDLAIARRIVGVACRANGIVMSPDEPKDSRPRSATDAVALVRYCRARSAAARSLRHAQRGESRPASFGTRHPYRGQYQRDRDRIVHSAAYRRLSAKTQVFTGELGDYHRTRLTHTIEVASVARTIGRALRLNEDLVEALALAHDLGHPPFGHAGESALDRCLAEHGGFNHNQHGLRIVTELERRYREFPGLNLTIEVLEGQSARATKATPGAERPLLEAQVVDAADSVAYDTHDVDDALEHRLLTMAELRELSLWREADRRVRWRYQDLDEAQLTARDPARADRLAGR